MIKCIINVRINFTYYAHKYNILKKEGEMNELHFKWYEKF